MAKGDVHVVREGKEWKVVTESEGRSRSRHTTQAEAARAGREIARRGKRELLVHGRDGRIRERSTYGRDPRKTRG